jgi:HEAT repeat protein
VTALASSNEAEREAAVARLTVIGARSIDPLIALVSNHDRGNVRAAALRALEGIGDARALPIALRAVSDADVSAACAAVALARIFLRGPRGAEAVDRLTTIALDVQSAERVRVAAIAALRDLGARTVAPLLRALSTDPNAVVQAEARGSGGSKSGNRSRGPEPAPAAESIRDWLAREGASAPLSGLLGIIERARDREAAAAPRRHADWTAIRFAAHLTLAQRGSRIALFDLRECLQAASEPLPADAMAALSLIGDASCLEPIAAAYTRSHNAPWRRQLLEIFHAIVTREKLTPRHAAMKKVEKKFGALRGAQ